MSEDDTQDNEITANPYPGLRPFQMQQAHLFFGRDEQRMELLSRLRQSHFLAVVGNSGSGKSSLVRAGLLPGLYGGFMDRSGSRWRIADTRPGGDPLGRLAAALDKPGVLSETGVLEDEMSFTEVNLRRSALGLVELVKEARLPENERLLILVDQFEELFRFIDETQQTEQAANDASVFVKLLLAAAEQTDVPIYVVMTMRTDYLGDCARFQDFPEAINKGQYLIPRLIRSQRREAIVGPAAVQGVTLSPILLNRLLNDVGDIPDHLPILQHALMRTWYHWQQTDPEDTEIRLEHYVQIGGMSEALLQHAEAIYNGLCEGVSEQVGKRRQLIAEKLFKCLTEESDTSQQVRRLAILQEIVDITEAEVSDVVDVIDAFRHPNNSFLMPPIEETLLPKTSIDISHESLIRNWDRLNKWAHQEAWSADTYKRLAHTAELYPEKEDLLVGQRLETALKWKLRQQPNKAWAIRYDNNYDQAMEFLDESEIETLTAEEANANKRRIKKTFFGGGLVAIVISMLLFVLGNVEAIIENEQQRNADIMLTKVYELWLRPLYPLKEQNPASPIDKSEILPEQKRHIQALKEIKKLRSHRQKSQDHKDLANKLSLDKHEKYDVWLLEVLTGPDKSKYIKKLQYSFPDDIRTTIASRFISRQSQSVKSIYDLFTINEDDLPDWVEESLEFLEDISLLLIFVLPLLIWRWFTLNRWKRGDKVKARSNPLWRILASLTDLGVAWLLAASFGAVVGMTFYISKSFQTLSDISNNDAVVIAMWVGFPVAIIYWLLRDIIKYRYKRSIGKIIFGLCPMTITCEPLNLWTSIKYNSFTFIAYFVMSLLTIPIYWIDWWWMLFFLYPILLIIWLILALKSEGRTFGDRFAKVRIIDVRSDEALQLELHSISDHTTSAVPPQADETWRVLIYLAKQM